MSTTIKTDDAQAFIDAIRSAAVSMSKDDSTPVLCGVRVVVKDGEARVAGTDRFRLTRITVPNVTGEATFTLDRVGLVNALKVLPKRTKRFTPDVPMSLVVDDERVQFQHGWRGEITANVATLDGDYPAIEKIATGDPVETDRVRLNPAFLADLNKHVMPERSQEAPIMQLHGFNKHVKFVWEAHNVRYEYVIMACRIND